MELSAIVDRPWTTHNWVKGKELWLWMEKRGYLRKHIEPSGGTVNNWMNGRLVHVSTVDKLFLDQGWCLWELPDIFWVMEHPSPVAERMAPSGRMN